MKNITLITLLLSIIFGDKASCKTIHSVLEDEMTPISLFYIDSYEIDKKIKIKIGDIGASRPIIDFSFKHEKNENNYEFSYIAPLVTEQKKCLVPAYIQHKKDYLYIFDKKENLLCGLYLNITLTEEQLYWANLKPIHSNIIHISNKLKLKIEHDADTPGLHNFYLIKDNEDSGYIYTLYFPQTTTSVDFYYEIKNQKLLYIYNEKLKPIFFINITLDY